MVLEVDIVALVELVQFIPMMQSVLVVFDSPEEEFVVGLVCEDDDEVVLVNY